MRLILILSVLVAAGLACSLPSSSSTPPPAQRPLNTAEAQQLEKQYAATLSNPGPSGEVTITITQDQLNGYIAGEMAQQGDSPISDPRVLLTNGQMEVFGKVSQVGISADARVVMEPSVDADGNIRLEVVSINLGSLPVPDVFKSQVQSMVDSTLKDYMAQNASQLRVTKIAITEGRMTITGVPKK